MRPLSELFGKEREQRQSVKPTLEVWSRGRIPAKVSERAATVAAVVRTHLTRRVVAHGKDEIERGRPRRCKLIPALAAQSLRRQVHFPEQLKRDRVNYPLGMTAGAEATEATATPLTNDALRQDAPRGVAGAQEQYVIWPISQGFVRTVCINEGFLPCKWPIPGRVTETLRWPARQAGHSHARWCGSSAARRMASPFA